MSTDEDDHGMICRCSPEGIAEADALVARVKSALSDPPIDDSEFVSALVMEFNWEHDAYVELLADQWLGVRIIRYKDKETLAYVECDRVEDGLAACYENIQKHAKEGKEDGTGSGGTTAGQAGDSDPARPADAPG